MVDAELILRFLALTRNWDHDSNLITNYKGQMKVFLNEFMNRNKSISESKTEEYRNEFYSTVEKVLLVFGNQAFRRINENGEYENSLNRAIMDVLMLVFNRINIEELNSKKKK